MVVMNDNDDNDNDDDVDDPYHYGINFTRCFEHKCL